MSGPEESLTQEDQHHKEARLIYETTRKVLLAAIGAVALTQDVVEDFIRKLIDRGEIAEKDGRRLIQEISEKRKKYFEDAGDEAHRHFYDVMKKLNIPTRKEIEDLNRRIAELNEKLEKLNQG